MPTPITDDSTFDATIQGPADADPQAAASYLPGYQGLANRTRWLRDQLIYPTPIERRVFVDLTSVVWSTAADGTPHWNFAVPNDYYARPISESAHARIFLRGMPHGAVLKSVEIQVQCSSSRADVHRWRARAYAVSHSDWSGDGVDRVFTPLGPGEVNDGGSATFRTIALTGLNHTVDNESGTVFVDLDAPTGPTTGDNFYGARVIFDSPGLRNW